MPFSCGAGELIGLEDTTELSQDEAEEDVDQMDCCEDAAADRFVNILMELGADKLFKEYDCCCFIKAIMTVNHPLIIIHSSLGKDPQSFNCCVLCCCVSVSRSSVLCGVSSRETDQNC